MPSKKIDGKFVIDVGEEEGYIVDSREDLDVKVNELMDDGTDKDNITVYPVDKSFKVKLSSEVLLV